MAFLNGVAMEERSGHGMGCSAASKVRDCGNPANLVALAQIRVDCAPDGSVLADPGADYVIRCTLQSIEPTNYWTMFFWS